MSTDPVLVTAFVGVAMAVGAPPAIAAAGQSEANFAVALFDGEIGHR